MKTSKANYIACKVCGVVMDADIVKSSTPPLFDENGVLDEEYAYWNGEEYHRYIICPVCQYHNRREGD